MPFWTRLRPGKRPMLNRALCDFSRRAFDLRLSRETALLLRHAWQVTPLAVARIVRKCDRQAEWEHPMPQLNEPNF